MNQSFQLLIAQNRNNERISKRNNFIPMFVTHSKETTTPY